MNKKIALGGRVLFFMCLSLFLFAMGGRAYAAVDTYVVSTINDTKLLPAMSVSSSPSTNMPVTVARGERTSTVSFVVRSDQAITGLTAEASAFTSGGNTLPSSIAQIRVLKSWYQAGYNNYDYVTANYWDHSLDVHYLTPELLLNDPTLVNVVGDDSWTQWNVTNPNGKNYLRLKDGSTVDVSIAAHQNIDNNNIQDAATLQPADLPANYNRQYVITFKVPSSASAGDYTGTIALKNGTTTFKTMNVALKVLPFVLPESPLEYSVYFDASINSGGINTYAAPENVWTAYAQNILDHGVTNPTIYNSPTNGISDTTLARELQIRQQVGINNDHIYYHHDGVIIDYDHIKTLFAPYGVNKIYNYGPDENECNRNQLIEEHNNGLSHFNAQSTYVNQSPDLLDTSVEFSGAIEPPNRARAALYHSYGHKVLAYGNPQTVPEWPRLWRYNYGLLLWQNDYDGAMPFSYDGYAGDAWNDFSDIDWYNRGHMFVYPTANGVVDTIQWEGYSEGINDVKYVAALQNAINSLNQSSNATVVAAQNYLNNLKDTDLSNADLDAVRTQLQDYTVSLYQLGANPSVAPEKITPTITWSTPASINYGTLLSGTQLNATASVAGSFAYTPVAGTKLGVGTHTLHVDFTPTDTARYNTASKEVTITVNQASTPSNTWYNSSYLYRRPITIDHTKVPNADQTNFPVLVSLIDNSLRTVSNGGKVQNANGFDIIFVDENNNKLDHEIESYNSSTGAVNIWVKVPTLTYSGDTVIYMYYDNSGISSSQENAAGVWGNGYGAVWHFKETGTNPTIHDSTANANNSSNQTWTPASGKVGGAASFNSTSQIATVNDSASLRPASNLTYSMWVKPSATNAAIFEKGIAYGGYGLRMTDLFSSYVAGWTNFAPAAMTINTSDWQYVTVVFSQPDVYIYYNGELRGRGTLDSASASSGVPLVIGGIYSWEAADGYQGRPQFNGSIDELHISDVARSADWVAAEYNNQSSPSSFYTLGSEEGQSSPNSVKAITAFSFNGLNPAVTGTINETNHTVSLSVPYGTNVTSLVPMITINGASISPNTGVARDFTSPVAYTVTAADSSTQVYTVTVTVGSNSAKAITAFNFNGLSPAVIGTINETDHTIVLTVPYGTSVTSLVPTITITGASVSPASGVARSFSIPATYTVTAADGSTQSYTVSVITTVATPTFSPLSGTYTAAQSVNITTATSNATIYYTTDGSDPTTSSSVYSKPITISSTTTLKAMAAKAGMNNSSIISTSYTINSISGGGSGSGSGGGNSGSGSSGGSTGSGSGGGTSASPVVTKVEIKSISGNTVKISFSVTGATQMMLSDNADFTGCVWEKYTTSKIYTKKDNQKDIYIRFKSANGTISSTVNLTIPTTVSLSSSLYSTYSTGTLLKLPSSPKVYVIIEDKKKWISTPEVFEQLGYKWGSIQTVTNEQLSAIPDYEDNLIRQMGDYKVYLVVNGVKHHIPNPEIFLDYGFLWTDVKDVERATIDKYKDTYLLKESGKDGIYYVNGDGIRKLIPTDTVFKSYNDKYEDVQVVSARELESYPLSNLVRLGGSNDIYLIEGNVKKRIPSPQVFNKYGFNWNHIMSVNQTEFDFYQDGGILQ